MQSDMFLSEFDETIDWEPLDIDEMDDFFNAIDYPGDDYVDIEDGDEDFLEEFDKETLLEILGLEDDGRTITISNEDDDDMLSESELFSDWNRLVSDQQTKSKEVPMKRGSGINKGIASLERALLGGVVPVEAGVGSGVLPGDQGFDPLDLSTKDYFKQIQNFILKLVPARKSVVADENQMQEPEAGAAMPTVGFVGDDDDRPPALILRDYREAEIRHGRLAMLAAIIWPLQEILDRIFIPDSFGSTTVIYGGPTLPFMPLLMTFFLLNLGYLDIYSR
jgi:glycosyltransferase involved in cell wall biosynthesis